MKEDMKMVQPQQQTALEKKSIFKNFISNPLGWLSIVIGVVGIILAAYFFYASREVAELCGAISSEKNIIFRKGENSKLKILYEKRKISSDVTSTQILLWNNGKKSIRPSNVLQPILIVVPNCEILDAMLIKESRPIINTKLNTEYQKKGILPISWDILEKGDGCKIQLIYTGGLDIPIKIVGVIEGQKNINTQKGTYLSLSKSNYRKNLLDFLLMIIAFIFISVLCISIIKGTVKSRKSSVTKTTDTIIMLLFLLLLLFSIFVICAGLIRFLQLKPPLEWI